MLAVTMYSLGNSSSITVSLNELLCLFSGPRFSVRQMHMVQLFIILSKETDYVFLSQPILSETQIYINVREEVS